MAVHENVTLQSCRVRVVNGVAAAGVDLFVTRDTTAGRVDEMVTQNPAAGSAGAVAQGILGMVPDTRPFASSTGTVVTSYVRPDGCEAIITLGEAVTGPGKPLKVGPGGQAFNATNSGDFVVGTSIEPGVAGQKVRFQFLNAGRLP